jgi:hypothetical protein
MSKEFLESSAKNDQNDLSSVVQEGGHWCICAWAFASAVERDSASVQGLELQCDATNGKLRDVYKSHIDLKSPSGLKYKSEAALKKVDQICGAPAAVDEQGSDSEEDQGSNSSADIPGVTTVLFLSLSIHVFFSAISARMGFCS